MSYDPQPVVLTSHELQARRVGPRRGKQHFEVSRVSSDDRYRDSLRDRPMKKVHKQPKAPGFNHEQMLQAYKGSIVTLVNTDGALVEVKLIDVDRYTLVCEQDGVSAIIFKHAIASVILHNKQELGVPQE